MLAKSFEPYRLLMNRPWHEVPTAAWQDPDFDPALDAFYYARVIEAPTPRWTAYDAMKSALDLPADIPLEVQERAYTSPIWYKAAGS